MVHLVTYLPTSHEQQVFFTCATQGQVMRLAFSVAHAVDIVQPCLVMSGKLSWYPCSGPVMVDTQIKNKDFGIVSQTDSTEV